MLKIDIITIFPLMFAGPFDLSIVKRAQDKGLVEIETHDLRKWTDDKRGTVDDRPYGGGTGMVMKVEPIAQAIDSLKHQTPNTKTVLTSPRGKVWSQVMARDFSKLEHLIIVCGHYEGVDERVSELIDDEVSIGDYVLTGGEIPAIVMVDSIVRLIPGVLKKEEATIDESFSSINIKSQAPNNKQIQNSKFKIQNETLLEYPQYTHPENYKGMKVPPVLLSGNHAEIDKWRKKMAYEKTAVARADLLKVISD